jgi:peptidoglycan/xylan/chitin deacetylase (PgdA/CDA1 family)
MAANVPTLDRRRFLTSAGLAVGTWYGLRAAWAQPAPTRRQIVVTIDDGPATGAGRELAPFLRVADALREAFVAEKVPAIMFVNERQLNVAGQRDARAAVLERWVDAGLDLGNHTYSHPNLGNVTLEAFCDDLIKGEVITRPLLDARKKKLTWFRYPFLATGMGATAKAVEDFLALRGYRIAPVTVDYHDYSFAGTYARHIRTGAMENAEQHFVNVMEALDVAFARAETRSKEVYEFVSMDQAMEDPAYKLPGLRPGAMGGGGFFNNVAAAKRTAAEGR